MLFSHLPPCTEWTKCARFESKQASLSAEVNALPCSPSYCMLYVLKYILFTAYEKPQRAVYFLCHIFLERTQDLDSSFSIKNGNLKNPEQDFSGHLLVCSVASMVTTEDILHYAWLTVHKTCLTAAEGWADFKPGHFQLHRTALTVPEAQSQCWAEDRTTPQFGNQASG